MSKKFKHLKAITPTEATMLSMKQRIDARIAKEKIDTQNSIELLPEVTHRNEMKITQTMPNAAILPLPRIARPDQVVNHNLIDSPYFRKFLYSTSFFLFLFAFHLLNPMMITSTVTSIRLYNAPHAHARSAITLNELAVLNKTLDTRATFDYQAAINTVTRTKTTLDELALMGEPGKYTMDECLSDYKEYYALLTHMKTVLASKTRTHDTEQALFRAALSNVLTSAQEEAEDRLGGYPEEVH